MRQLITISLLTSFILLTAANDKPKKKETFFSAKTIDKNLAKVSDKQYAYRYETSNEEYRFFLSSVRDKQPDLYNRYAIDSTRWAGYGDGDGLVQYYHNYPSYANYPIVNISHEAAEAYCSWLTDIYNSDPKRKFKKVIFLLPTASEWTKAAQGGRTNAMYPWGNFYLRNRTGSFLCNFTHISEQQVVSDSLGKPMLVEGNMSNSYPGRTYFTAPVKSFYPNDFGLYNMSGNAAEMIADKSIAMGGSWKSFGGEVMTMSKKNYTGSSPDIGFRVFMNVIEE